MFNYQTMYRIFLLLEFGLHNKYVKRNNKFPLENHHVCVCLVKLTVSIRFRNFNLKVTARASASVVVRKYSGESSVVPTRS